MGRIWWAVISLLVAVLCTPPVAHAQRRVALLIGNGAYTKVPELPNPSRDAAALERLLRASGFDFVRRADNLGLADMRRALRDFAAEVASADIAVAFFAGHGIEVNGTNYLIPIDAALERDLDVEDEALPLERVSQILEPAKRLRLIILDACRENPFVRTMKRSVSSRSIGRGLAKVEVLTSDTLVAYAAKAGLTASDGSGANSPYTLALLNHLTTPGLDVRLALGRVRDEVLKTTASRQEPFVYGSLGGAEIALVPGTAAETTKPVEPAPSKGLRDTAEAWALIKDTTSTAELEAFVRRFGDDTFYADLAKARLALLQQKVAAGLSDTSSARNTPAKETPIPPTAELQAAIDNLFTAWNRLDASLYIAQWAPDGVKIDLKAGTRKTRTALRADREGLFARLSRADARYSARLREYEGGIALFDVSYSLAVYYKNGRKFSESACETYRIERRGTQWLIVINEDYVPCR